MMRWGDRRKLGSHDAAAVVLLVVVEEADATVSDAAVAPHDAA